MSRHRKLPGILATGLGVASVMTLGVPAAMSIGSAPTAGAATPRPSAETTVVLPAGTPTALVRPHDIVVLSPASGGVPARLGRVLSAAIEAGHVVVTAVRVPPNALEKVTYSVHGSATGLRAAAIAGGTTAGTRTARASDTGYSCSNASGEISGTLSFSPSAGGSLGVTWVDVWGDIIWKPEISGGVWVSPNVSMSVAGLGFSGSCQVNFGTPQYELATVDTFAGPLSLCFGAEDYLGGSASGTVNQLMSASLGGSVGTNFDFGVTGAGLSPFNNLAVSGGSGSPGSSFGGSVYIGGGPYLDGEWGICGVAGVGVKAALNSTFTLSGSSSGWTADVSESVDTAVNLNLLGLSYNQSIYNWNAFSDTIASGGWPSGGGGGGGGGGCGTDSVRSFVIIPC